MDPGTQLIIRSVGETSVTARGELLPLTGGREFALLVYLAWIQRRTSRDDVVDLLWSPGDRARRLHSLSQLVYRLGRCLPAGILVATKSELAVRPDRVALDAVEFRRAIEEGRYREAFKLSPGRFLPGFVLRGAPEFQRWREDVSSELRRLSGILLRKLLSEFEQTGEWLQFQQALDRLLEDNPQDFDLHRRQIRALLMRGERAEAQARHLRLIERFRSVEHRAELAQLAEEIQRYTEIPEPLRSAEGGLRIRLIGRRAEQDALRSELAFALRGQSRFVELVATAGLGKSRLLEHFGRFCVLRGVRLLAGRCYPGGRQLPYSGIESVLTSVQDADLAELPRDQWPLLASVIPSRLGFSRPWLSTPDPETGRRQLFQAIDALLKAMATRQPLAILLDDFHWADDSTAILIQRITRNLSDFPILVVIAARPEELMTGTRAAEVLLVEQPTRRIQLTELDDESVRAMIAAFQEAAHLRLPLGQIRAIASRASGHPLFLTELLASAAAQAGEHAGRDAPVVWVDEEIPQTVTDHIRARFARLSNAAKAVADGLAIIGTPADHELVRTVVGLQEEEYVASAEQLARTGLVADQGRTIAFRHDLVREAAYDLISGARRAWLHGRVARALEERGGIDVGVLATHYDLAGYRQKAYEYADAAAASAERMWALPEAEHFLQMGLRNASDPVSIVNMTERLGNCMLERGAYESADHAFEMLENMPDQVLGTHRRLTVRAKRIAIASVRGPLSSSHWSELGWILARAAETGDEVERLQIIRHVLPALWDGGRIDLIMEEIHAVMSRLEAAPPTALGLQVLGRLCQILILSDGPLTALRWTNVLCERAEGLGDPSVKAVARLARALGYHYMGRGKLAEQDFESARHVITTNRLNKYVIPYCIYYGVMKGDIGDYAASSESFHEATERARKEGDWRNYVCVKHNQAFYAYERGLVDEAREAAREVVSREGLGAWYNEASTWALMGLISMEAGDRQEALAVRRRLQETYLPRRIWGPDISYVEIFLARMEVLDGRRDAALARLSEVIKAYDRRDVFCLSRVQLEKARMLVDTDPEEARALARTVRARGSEIGAPALMDRAEAILRGLRGGRSVVEVGWGRS